MNQPTTGDEKNYTTAEAAMILKKTKQTLANWRYKGKGPQFVKTGPARTDGVLYRESDLELWLKQNTKGGAKPK